MLSEGTWLKSDNKNAYFFHPAYPQPLNLLFALPCVDPIDEGDALATGQPKGLHHHTALLACQIIADNAFESGQLYFDRQGAQPVSDRIPIHGLLTPGDYFFLVNSDRNFRDWRFPHGYIPEAWPSTKSGLATDTGRRCALTNSAFGLTSAHIIPREEGEWFMQNGMSRYGADLRDVNDSRNLIRLRADIHRCFDTRLFSIVSKPKFASSISDTLSTTTDPAYVLHVFGTNIGEFSSLYHNMCFQYLENTSHEFLFARLAWTILILIKPFVLAGLRRSVIRCRNGEDGFDWRAEELSGADLSSFYGGGGSRSASPKKRSRPREKEDRDSLADADEWTTLMIFILGSVTILAKAFGRVLIKNLTKALAGTLVEPLIR
ncbi:uncharacterized protein LY79DRAFT_594448 [Colletotrichum navitas]|uniref:HNH nuclease domain-containing protein n=1 Tax=Colletotrichum navitas TaxID=681940 RepID=A0AAD8PM32_9PEZI|nr:uncharacterized protein LY79DRAFT_594448 [Colletotrichum navitas]KAK1570206.1 hypothetical protein LY79DRAFT_594448 [Colletotrichum navitas]